MSTQVGLAKCICCLVMIWLVLHQREGGLEHGKLWTLPGYASYKQRNLHFLKLWLMVELAYKCFTLPFNVICSSSLIEDQINRKLPFIYFGLIICILIYLFASLAFNWLSTSTYNASRTFGYFAKYLWFIS